MSTQPGRALLWTWSAGMLVVLVPKRRGHGFLREPYGHHPIAGLDAIGRAVGCDIYGLDGALDILVPETVYWGGDAARTAFASRIVPMLEAHYACPARAVTLGEFWAQHPIGQPRVDARRQERQRR